jgi:uncharacterized protein (TIGR02453 family)
MRVGAGDAGRGGGSAGEAMPDPVFTRKTFRFLEDLRANNDRNWFKENKDRYEDYVKAPAIRFILDFAPSLKAISPHFRADPRAVGGSLFRIYRDTRFSKDKSPYKTHTGIQFRHEQGKSAHAPGFYLHLEPGECFIGLGLWRPDGRTLKRIREGLVENPDGWRKAISEKAFRDRFALGGDRLVRAPRGFDPEHPLVEDLKRKDFVAMASFPSERAIDPDFMSVFAEHCRSGAPMMAYLCGLLGLPF